MPLDTFKVMSFNVRYDNEEDPFLWEDRVQALTEIVKKYTPDVIGFQEVKENMYGDLQEKIGTDYDSYGVLRSTDDGAEMSAIFVQNERLALRDAYTFWLSDTPKEPYSVGWDAALPRIASVATIVDKETENELFVMMNTHFDHVGIEARVKSAELLQEKMEAIRKEGLPVVLSGDFNVYPTDLSYEILTKNEWLSDSYSTLSDEERANALTFHDFKGGTEGMPIDYIMVSEPFKITKSEIIRDQVNEVYPSDHYPVMVEIELK